MSMVLTDVFRYCDESTYNVRDIFFKRDFIHFFGIMLFRRINYSDILKSKTKIISDG